MGYGCLPGGYEKLRIPCHSARFGGRAGGVVRHHPRGLPVPGQHYVAGRRAADSQLGRQPNLTGIRGGLTLNSGGQRGPRGIATRSSASTTAPRGLPVPDSWPPVGVRIARDAVLHEPHVIQLTLRIRLASAHGDQRAIAVGRIGDVGPAQHAHLTPPHPRHEQQSRDHRIEPPALEGDLVVRHVIICG